ncbi:PAS domain-containing sensor histidine kinase [Metabacillus niabensis]|uniref:histidine kinase n=2 Tax=Metabacillus niabensis TaxID=324854 RepID=A0ABT9Z0T8_9BACI|nr:PAS domain S-box protein [Metabacillus niabensis]MDQ0225589.1 PAS domain S-box-containing protein [Metabacillus niabensis]
MKSPRKEKNLQMIRNKIVALIIIDEMGRINSINQAAKERFNLQITEWKGKDVQALFPLLNVKKLFSAQHCTLTTKASINGTTANWLLSCELIELGNHHYCMLSIANDKDEMNSNQGINEELQASLSELVDLKFALDESSIIAITDRQGIITYVNDKFCEVSKYSREELIGKSHRLVNSGYHSADFFRHLWQTIASGTVWKGEIKNKAKDGTYYWVDTTIVPFLNKEGKPYQYLAIRNEITARKRAEAELEETIAELYDLKFAIDESSIVAITDQKGIITYVNDTFCKISKFSRDELIGNSHRIINAGFHSPEFFKELWRTIGKGKVWKGEIKNKAKDGTYYWVNTTIIPFINNEGKPYQYLAIRNEITARKRAEEELQQMMRKLIGLQEDERKKLSRELHDGIGQNLYSLLIMTNRLRSKPDLEIIDQIEMEISNVIDEIRQISWQLRPSILDDLGLIPAIRSFINKVTTHYGLKTHFTYELQRRLSSDVETNIYRIVQEAITNACKYAKTDELALSIVEKTDHLEVSITDKGIGFDQTKTQSGVGLFSMEERARTINANLNVSSIKNKGTTITLKVPFSKESIGNQ